MVVHSPLISTRASTRRSLWEYSVRDFGVTKEIGEVELYSVG